MEPTMNRFRQTCAVISLLTMTAQSTGAADLVRLMAPPPGAHVALRAPPPQRAPGNAPAPRPAPEAGPAWSESAAVVGAYVADGLRALWAMHANPVPLPGAGPRPETAALEAEPAAPTVVEAPASVDRIMIVGGTGVIGAYGELDVASHVHHKPQVYQERFTGYWSAGEGVSVRVDYLEPLGINKGDASGFTLLFKDHPTRRVESRGGVPPLLRREHPIYFAGDEVTVELTLRNDTGRFLKDVIVQTGQEGLMLDGSAGPKLDAGRFEAPRDLAPGESKTLRWTIKMGRVGAASGVNFEQTAVRVMGPADDGKYRDLLNVHQAGIVDPPSL